uniref:Uncharacterized protein n=1 Tax=Romanomermis culicivorax TaxID=13658 RepID=A0A915L0F4_ROMCU
MGSYSVWNILLLLCLWCSESQQQQQTNDNLWDAYQKCKNTLGKPNWLCDPNHRVDQGTTKELNDLLWKFQTEVPCYCKLSKDCYRYGNLTIMSGVVASMIVVDSFPPDYGKTIKRIYDDANLDVRGTCSNGLLVVVGYKTYEMFTYRGMLTGTSLTEQQAKDAMNRTALELQATDGASRFALPMLLNDYIDHLKSGSYGRSRNWEAMVGMVVAALICAIAAAVALAIFFTSCCLKKKKKPWRLEKAILPPVPSEKELEQQRKMKLAALRRLKKIKRASAMQKARYL